MKDSCERIRDDLPLQMQGVLDGERAAAVEWHLRTCVECRAERELLGLLQRPIEAPAGLRSRLERTLATPQPQRAPGVRPGVLAAALAVVALGGTLLIGRPDDTDVTAPVDVEAAELGWAARIDPVLHGGPGLDALTDDELELLLEEVQS